MVRNAGRAGVEIEAGVVARGQAGQGRLLAGRAAADGEAAAAGARARLEHVAVVAERLQLDRRGHPGESAAEDRDAGAAGRPPADRGRRWIVGEEPEAAHRLVHGDGAGGLAEALQEMAA